LREVEVLVGLLGASTQLLEVAHEQALVLATVIGLERGTATGLLTRHNAGGDTTGRAAAGGGVGRRRLLRV
jgi:hypothetical protein